MTNMTASEMGKIGGKKSAESRFKGMTKKQISERMRQVRLCKKAAKISGEIIKEEG